MPSDYGHEFADKELKKLESKLTKEYKQAAAEVEKKMKDFLSKFEEKDKKMLAKVQSGEMTAKEYAEWRKGQIMTGKRWEDMRDTLAQDLVNADKIAAGMINDSLPNAYAENMNFGTYEVESGVNIDTGFTLYDKNTVKNLMKKDPQIIPQARVDIPKDELWNRRKLTSAVMQGILQGESIPNIAKRLRSVADMDRNAAIRNARTYTTAAENKGRVDSYERANDMGIQVKQMWMATLDDRTRVEHRHLDGQVREIGEDFEVDGYKIRYPGDPSAEPEMIYCCRCTLVADLPKYGKDLERNESKLGDMTYEEWKHAKDRATVEFPKEEKGITKPEIPENVRKENLDDVAESSESKEPEKLRREQIDTGYIGQIPSDKLEEYNKVALESIINDTGYDEKSAKIFQADLNEYLGGDYESFTSGNQTERVARIDDGLDRMPAYDGNIYRGMHIDNDSELNRFLEIEKGDEIRMKSISSWSSKLSVAERYSDRLNSETSTILFECVENKSSVGVQHISKWGTSEAEVLAKSTTSWNVIEKITQTKYEYLKEETEKKLENFEGKKYQKRIYEKLLEDLENKKDDYSQVYIIKIKVGEK